MSGEIEFQVYYVQVGDDVLDMAARDCGFESAQAVRDAAAAERVGLTPAERKMLDEADRRIVQSMFGE